MSTQKKRTNVQIVTDVMTKSVHGPLAEVFVIEAIHEYVDRVLQAPEPESAKSLFAPGTWKTVATDVSVRLKEYEDGRR